jgi:hypothetical protein
MHRMQGRALAGALAIVVALVAAPVASAFDPAEEASNYSKGLERQAVFSTPAYQLLLRR